MGVQTKIPVTDYFNQARDGALAPDVIEYVKWLTFEDFDAPLYSPGEDFGLWSQMPQRHLKYALAFSAYGFANAAFIDEKYRQFAIHALNFAIIKMKHEIVWVDWKEDGFGDDPVLKGNIMYKGHLHLMYGLFQLLSGDTRYEDEYQALSRIIFDELEENPYTGYCCEPDNYFPQCNSIAFYSLYVYDRIYGTQHGGAASKDWLEFLKDKLIDEERGVFYASYHPSTCATKPFDSAYTGAWTLSYLHAIYPQEAEALYEKFKAAYIHEHEDGAFAVESIGDEGVDVGAQLFTMLLAREMNDADLFEKLLSYTEQHLPDDVAVHMLFNAKTNVGLRNIIDADWPGAFGTN